MRQGTRLALDTPELQQWREEQHKYFQSLAIVNREGRLVGGVTSETTRVHYAQQPWWPIVFGQGRSWAGDLLVDEKGRNHWEVAVPVSDEDGSVLGVLKVGIRTDDLLASVLRTTARQVTCFRPPCSPRPSLALHAPFPSWPPSPGASTSSAIMHIAVAPFRAEGACAGQQVNGRALLFTRCSVRATMTCSATGLPLPKLPSHAST